MRGCVDRSGGHRGMKVIVIIIILIIKEWEINVRVFAKNLIPPKREIISLVMATTPLTDRLF